MRKIYLIVSIAVLIIVCTSSMVQAQTFSIFKDINPTGNSDASGFSIINGQLFVSANDGVHGQEFWLSDGSEANTSIVIDINPGGAGSYPSSFIKVGNTIFFVANNGTNGDELWRTDGTAAGTY